MGRSRTLQHGYGVIWMTRESIERSLAQCLYQQGLCRYGCGQEGFSTVEFRYDVCGLWTTFKYQYPERVEGYTDRTKDYTKDHTKVLMQLSVQQKEIIEYLQKQPRATRKELVQNSSNATLGGIIHNIARLQELGLLCREGGRKGGYWQVLVTNDKNKSSV